MNERFEGIVLFKRPHRDHDALVKVFTRTHGTKMIFVRGGLKVGHPLASQLVPLTKHDYIGNLNDTGLSFLKEGHTLQFYPRIQSDMMAQAYAAYIAQLVDASIEDNEPDESLYQLLAQALKVMDDGQDSAIVALYMEFHLLKRFGFYFEWQKCSVCGQNNEPFQFSLQAQGVLCSEHATSDTHCLPTSGRALHILKLLANLSLTQINRVNISPATWKDLRELMGHLYHEQVGIRLKSRSYLQQLWTMEQQIIDVQRLRKLAEDEE